MSDGRKYLHDEYEELIKYQKELLLFKGNDEFDVVML